MTIIVEEYNPEYKTIKNREICHDIIIPRKKRLYKRDKQGYYYIPEVVDNGKIS